MIIEKTRRPDSAIDAAGVALGVLARPAFLWAPIIAALLLALPVLLLPVVPIGPTTEAEIAAFVQESLSTYVMVLAFSFALSLVVGPFVSAMTLRLAGQYLDDSPARPFAPGLVNLAWRFFQQLLIFAGFALTAVVIFVAIFALGALAGQAILVLVIEIIVGSIVFFAVSIRLLVAAPALLAGRGPWESVKSSWNLTRGHVRLALRWVLVPIVLTGLASSTLGAFVQSTSAGQQLSGPASVLITGIMSPLTLVYVIVLVQLYRRLVALAASAHLDSSPGSDEIVESGAVQAASDAAAAATSDAGISDTVLSDPAAASRGSGENVEQMPPTTPESENPE